MAAAELEAVRRVFEEVAARLEPHGQVVRPLDVLTALNEDTDGNDTAHWSLARVRVILNSVDARAWWTPSRRAAAQREGKRVRAQRSQQTRLVRAAQDIPPSPPLLTEPPTPSEEHDEYFGAVSVTLDLLADYLRIAERRLVADDKPLAWANVALQRQLEAAARLIEHYRALGETALLELEAAS